MATFLREEEGKNDVMEYTEECGRVMVGGAVRVRMGGVVRVKMKRHA